MARDTSKTEAPTPKRRRKARSEGQIPKSAEVVGWTSFLAASLILPLTIRHATGHLGALLQTAQAAASQPTEGSSLRVLDAGLRTTAAVIAPIGVTAFLVGTLAGVGQMGRPNVAGIKPSGKRTNPVSGFKRVFSTHGPLELGKALARLIAIIAVAVPILDTAASRSMATVGMPLSASMSVVAGSGMELMRVCAGIGLTVAAADYAISRRRTQNMMKMTKQEIKDEARESDGDPMVRSRRRSLAMRMSRMRMMAALADATAVVVNPTHYAVALTYRSGDPAPKVVAKGVDDVALRIRERAQSLGVPIVEDPPLARALHAACDIDHTIPGSLFLATARLLAFVYQLPDLARHYPSQHHTPATSLPETRLVMEAAG